jgi:hypothetical protein
MRSSTLRSRLAFLIVHAAACCASAQALLPGEFGNIDLGRSMLAPTRFPTVSELRNAVNEPQIHTVLMLKLHADGHNHFLPTWSHDGARLAVQQSNLKQRSSKILLFPTLSQPKPAILDEGRSAYDHMFRWGQNSAAGYALARIDPASGDVQVLVSVDGGIPAARTRGTGRRLMPHLYERTDGIWRMAYEQNGDLLLEAWRGSDVIDEPFILCRGGSPRWNSSGTALLMTRARDAKLGAFDIVKRVLATNDETQHSSSDIVRSPAWSPDEQLAAFFAKDAGDNKPWRIEVASLGGEAKAKVLVQDVVVNSAFESDQPAWEPGSRRVWCFSHRYRQQTYYPLVAADVADGEQIIDYPRVCTNPSDLAINPRTHIPELVFVGHDELPQDVYVLLLNHF